MRTATAILLGLLLAPLTALISAKCMALMWEWFVFRDYGQGPSLAAWYGLSGIFGMAIAPAILHLKSEKDKESDPILKVISRVLGVWVGLGLVLGIAWLVGLALHWH